MKKNPIRLILTIILAIVFVCSAGWVIQRQMHYKESGDTYNDAMKLAGLSADGNKAKSTSAPTEAPQQSGSVEAGSTATPAPTLEPAPPELSDLAGVDLAALQEVNPDVIGWIAVPDTDLSYPLMVGEDNQYYLEHSWDHEYNPCGSIFLECTNSPDLSDYHTIIYGHRMANDSMFGMLRFYQDDTYRKEHPSVYVVYGDELRKYNVFAAYEADVEGIVYQLNIEQKHRQEEFINACLESSVIDTGLKPSPDQQILTLSTCPSSGYSSRLVVQGYLAKAYRRN